MPPYDLIGDRSVILALLVGVAITIGLILARSSRMASFTTRERSDEEIEENVHEFGGGVSERDAPVPIFIWLLATAYLLWAAGYVVYVARFGL